MLAVGLVFDVDVGDDGDGAQSASDLAYVFLAQRQAGDGGDGVSVAAVAVDGAEVELALIDHYTAEVGEDQDGGWVMVRELTIGGARVTGFPSSKAATSMATCSWSGEVSDASGSSTRLVFGSS